MSNDSPDNFRMNSDLFETLIEQAKNYSASSSRITDFERIIKLESPEYMDVQILVNFIIDKKNQHRLSEIPEDLWKYIFVNHQLIIKQYRTELEDIGFDCAPYFVYAELHGTNEKHHLVNMVRWVVPRTIGDQLMIGHQPNCNGSSTIDNNTNNQE